MHRGGPAPHARLWARCARHGTRSRTARRDELSRLYHPGGDVGELAVVILARDAKGLERLVAGHEAPRHENADRHSDLPVAAQRVAEVLRLFKGQLARECQGRLGCEEEPSGESASSSKPSRARE